MTLDGPLPIMDREACGKRDDIADSLVRTLFVKMAGVLAERMPKRPFTKQHQLREHLGFDRSHPALGKRIPLNLSLFVARKTWLKR